MCSKILGCLGQNIGLLRAPKVVIKGSIMKENYPFSDLKGVKSLKSFFF